MCPCVHVHPFDALIRLAYRICGLDQKCNKVSRRACQRDQQRFCGLFDDRRTWFLQCFRHSYSLLLCLFLFNFPNIPYSGNTPIVNVYLPLVVLKGLCDKCRLFNGLKTHKTLRFYSRVRV